MSGADVVRVRELYNELDRLREVGPRLMDFLQNEVIPAEVKKFPNVSIYNNGRPWDAASRQDLAQEVALEQLFLADQLGWVLNSADRHSGDLRAVRRRLAYTVRRTLLERRKRLGLIEDRLVERCRKLAAEPPFATVQLVGQEYLCLAGREAEDPPVQTEPSLRRLVNLDQVRLAPRLRDSGGSKQSMGYTKPVLRNVLKALLDATGILSPADLRRIFSLLFTPFRPSPLFDFENHEHYLDTSEPTSASEAQLLDLVSEIVEQLTEIQCLIILGKAQRRSDGELSLVLDISRPIVQKRREEAAAIVQRAVGQLDDGDRDRVYDLLVDQIGIQVASDDDD